MNPTASEPLVSIVTGVYNTMPYLTKTLSSAVDQTIGHDRMEIVVIDDGSTDGSAEEIDRFAARYPGLFRVIHQENSGGPSAPRNLGIEVARGRYIFFLDADDFLGPEAMERAVAMAERNESDVVLCKMVGVNGRKVPRVVFRSNRERADVFNCGAYSTLGPTKLFRRELLMKHDIRFDTTMRNGEDQPFTGQAYVLARNISIIGDYDCLFVTRRDDGKNLTITGASAENKVRIVTTMLPLVGRLVPEGPQRDRLMRRHVREEVHTSLTRIANVQDVGRRERLLTDLREMVAAYVSEPLIKSMPAQTRLRLRLLLDGRFDELVATQRRLASRNAKLHGPRHGSVTIIPEEVTVEDGRFFAHYPGFRSAAPALPDDLFDITAELVKNLGSGRLFGDVEDVRLNGDVAGSAVFGRALLDTLTVESVDGYGEGLRVRVAFPSLSPLDTVELRLAATAGKEAVSVPFRALAGEQRWEAVLPLDREGEVALEVVLEQRTGRMRCDLPWPEGREGLRWRRRGRMWYVRRVPQPGTRIRVGRVDVVKGVRRRLTGAA